MKSINSTKIILNTSGLFLVSLRASVNYEQNGARGFFKFSKTKFLASWTKELNVHDAVNFFEKDFIATPINVCFLFMACIFAQTKKLLKVIFRVAFTVIFKTLPHYYLLVQSQQ